MFSCPSEHSTQVQTLPSCTATAATTTTSRRRNSPPATGLRKVFGRKSKRRSEDAKDTEPLIPPPPQPPLASEINLSRRPDPIRAEMEKLDWYHGVLRSAEAEEVLRYSPVGSFVFRGSASLKNEYSVTYKAAGAECRHLRIERNARGLFSLKASDPNQLCESTPDALLLQVVERRWKLESELPDANGHDVVSYLEFPVPRVRNDEKKRAGNAYEMV